MTEELGEREKAESEANPHPDVTATTTEQITTSLTQTTISAPTHQLTTSITQPVTLPTDTTTNIQPRGCTLTETTTVLALSTASPTLTATVLTPSPDSASYNTTVATSVLHQPTVSTGATRNTCTQQAFARLPNLSPRSA